jgi:hypothetical protein
LFAGIKEETMGVRGEKIDFVVVFELMMIAV